MTAPAEEGLDLDGAGVFSSGADLYEALHDGDAAHVAAATEAFALDLMGVAMDPVGELLQGAVGWLIEHLWFLREPLDALAGDPAQVRAQARQWTEVSETLHGVAVAYPRSAAALAGWDGAAAQEYRAAVADYAFHTDRAAGAARAAAEEIVASAAAVGTVRSTIRDLVAEFVAAAIQRALPAMAFAGPTGGASVAAFAATVVLEAVELARHNTRLVGRLLDGLADSAERLAAIERLVGCVRDGMVEHGKQAGEGRQEQREWVR